MAIHEISITLEKRCKLCNMQPQYGNLSQAHASRVLRNAFIESFAQSQLNTYEITKDQLGNYHVSESKKDSPTMVRLDDDSLNCFKEFIDGLSEKQRVFFADEQIFSTVIDLWNQAHPQEETTDVGE